MFTKKIQLERTMSKIYFYINNQTMVINIKNKKNWMLNKRKNGVNKRKVKGGTVLPKQWWYSNQKPVDSKKLLGKCTLNVGVKFSIK